MDNFCEHLTNFNTLTKKISIGVLLLYEHFPKHCWSNRKFCFPNFLFDLEKSLKSPPPNVLYF